MGDSHYRCISGGAKLTVILSKICAILSHFIPTDIICAAHISKAVHINLGYDEKNACHSKWL